METYYSSLKKCNVLETDFLQFQKLIDGGKSETQPLKVMGLQIRPNTKEENHEMIRNVWKIQGHSTILDHLEWYNNLDVIGGVKAVEKMLDYYNNKK